MSLRLIMLVLIGALCATGALARSLSELPKTVKADTRWGPTCLVPDGLGNLLRTEIVEGVVIRAWDRDRDGVQDAETQTELIGGPNRERPFPHAYLLDSDFDGTPDQKFMDVAGDGRCEDLHEIPVRNQRS